jgi:hypothetical protein
LSSRQPTRTQPSQSTGEEKISAGSLVYAIVSGCQGKQRRMRLGREKRRQVGYSNEHPSAADFRPSPRCRRTARGIYNWKGQRNSRGWRFVVPTIPCTGRRG